MPVLIFDQQPRAYKDPITEKIAFTYIPVIPVKLSYKYRLGNFRVDCLLDSGADRNIFPSDYARILGINIKKGKLVEHIGIGGSSLLAYAHKLKLFVGNHSFQTVVDFNDYQAIPLLGREGFFKFFKRVSLSQESKQVELEY